MANNIEFNVIVTGLDKFQQNAINGSKGLETFKQSAITTGRELDKVGQIALLTGTAITGPLALAFKDAAKYSSDVSDSLDGLSTVTDAFQKEIATAMIPVVNGFVGILNNLFNAFNSLSPAVKDQIVQGALLAGAFLLISGLAFLVIGRLVIMSGEIAGLASKFLAFAAVNPVLVAVGVGLVFLIALMFKFKDVADDVLNIFQFLFLALKNGFLVVTTNVTLLLSKMYDGLANVYGLLAKIPGPTQAFFQSSASGAANLAKSLNDISDNSLKGVLSLKEIGTQITSGTTSWAAGFQNAKNQVLDFLNTLGGKGSAGTTQLNNFVTGFQNGLDQIGVKIGNLKQQGTDFANTLETGMSTAFSNIVLGTESASQAFAEFGAAILKAIVDFITQWVAFQILSKVFTAAATALGISTAATLAAAYAPAAAFSSLASFGGNAAPAQAGIVSTVGLASALSVPKFAQGSSGIVDDTLGLFNKGEIVIPNTFSSAINRGDLSLSGPNGNNNNSGPSIGQYFDFAGAKFNGITDKLVQSIFTKASENIRAKKLTALPA